MLNNPLMVPIQVPFFDGWQSYFHAVLGFAAGVDTSSPMAALIALGFLIYQMLETEPLANKLGDFAEFATGYLVAASIPAQQRRRLRVAA